MKDFLALGKSIYAIFVPIKSTCAKAFESFIYTSKFNVKLNFDGESQYVQKTMKILR